MDALKKPAAMNISRMAEPRMNQSTRTWFENLGENQKKKTKRGSWSRKLILTQDLGDLGVFYRHGHGKETKIKTGKDVIYSIHGWMG